MIVLNFDRFFKIMVILFIIAIPMKTYAKDDANVLTNLLLTTYVNPTAQAFKNESWQTIHTEDGYAILINPFMSREYLNLKLKDNNNLIIATLLRTTVPAGDEDELPNGGMGVSRIDIDCTDKEFRALWSHAFDHNDKYLKLVGNVDVDEWQKANDEVFEKVVNFACYQFLPK
ncbi:hypothetical protein ABFP25_06025 [Acinetobacter indicus]|jgi:hypothetical protein|uniref:hypothetical protein n=1 Tax=Acinetobacter indicus TaxID=756892 RepID=UPI0032152A03